MKQELAIARSMKIEKLGLAITVELKVGVTTVTVPWNLAGGILADMAAAGNITIEGIAGRGVVVEESDHFTFSFVSMKDGA